VWMGSEYSRSVAIVQILAVGYFFNIITGAASTLSAGLGRTELDRRYGVFTAIVNLVVVVGLSLLIGPLGVAWGTSFTLLLGAFYFIQMFHALIRVPFEDMLSLLWRPVSASVISALIVFVAASFVSSYPTSRVALLFEFLGIAAAYSILYVVLLAAVRGIGREDVRMVTDAFHRKPLTT
jgi:O-antigen/teichoic acid export membrane protein